MDHVSKPGLVNQKAVCDGSLVCQWTTPAALLCCAAASASGNVANLSFVVKNIGKYGALPCRQESHRQRRRGDLLRPETAEN